MVMADWLACLTPAECPPLPEKVQIDGKEVRSRSSGCFPLVN
jgi:hypothetical protein